MNKDLKRQGHLDGLCGIYAVVNAAKAVLGKSVAGDEEILFLFRTLCRSVSAWPLTLWEGLNFEELIDIVDRTICHNTILNKLDISYPFTKSTPQSSDQFWQRFHEIFERNSGAYAVIGMTHPHLHWVTATPKSRKQLSIIDSSPCGDIRVKNISQIFAGERLQKGYHWKIERSEVILFAPRSS